MNDYLFLIFPIVLLLLYFYGCQKSEATDFISRDQGKMLQVLACLFIVLHHLTQKISTYGNVYRGPITILSSMGILFTSIFFFFSGYGLIVSVNSKPTYLDHFLRHRLSTILVPFFTANIVAVIMRLHYVKIPLKPMQIVQCIFGYALINGNGWYIVELFFIYIAFYILFKLIKNKKIATILLCVFVLYLIYIGYGKGHDKSTLGDHWFMGEWWYNSTIVFVYGVIFATFKDKVVPFIRQHHRFLTVLFSVLFILSFIAEEIINGTYGYYQKTNSINGINPQLITLIAQMAVCLIFTTLIILIQMRITVRNVAIRWLSSISLELYLIHGLFIKYVFNIKGLNEMLLYALVIVCGILSAVVMHAADKVIIDKINDLGD